jgi:hypothetical protein
MVSKELKPFFEEIDFIDDRRLRLVGKNLTGRVVDIV